MGACYRQHAVVTQTNTLMEVLTQNNTLVRFGLGLQLRSQTQTISLKRRGAETIMKTYTRRLTEAILKLWLWWSTFG